MVYICNDNSPSIIGENFISCYECYNNPKGWSSSPNCYSDLYLNSIGSIEQIMQGTDSLWFYFDGKDLNLCNSCWEIYSIQDEQGNYD